MFRIVSEIPEGITIGKNQFGRCLIATKQFKKGSVVYIGRLQLIDSDIIKYELIIGQNKYEIDTTHSVETINGKRQLYGFDGFMNHSCDPNVICPADEHDPNTYTTYATKDIEIGDEITCDYAIFDYNCEGHQIEVCRCGSSQCRGSMLGFKNLSLKQQIPLLGQVDETILIRFLQDNPNVIIIDVEKNLPPTIGINTENVENIFLEANMRIPAGELIFQNTSKILTDSLEIFILKIGNIFKLLNREEHFIHREGYLEMLGFDTFMNHACNPSTYQKYVSRDRYDVYAKKAIYPGDKITCDYFEIQNHELNLKSIPSIKFSCFCGAPDCKGEIHV